ncbi:MAG: tetratricopeptide repeat protein [Gaiella sp.]
MRRRTALLAATGLAAAIGAGSLLGGVLTESRQVGASRVSLVQWRPGPALAERAVSGVPGAGTAASVADLETLVRAEPRNADALGVLGLAYQLRWRETGDASYLPRARAALTRALAARPADPTATLGLGSLALTQHEFVRALELGRTARRLSPYSAKPLGVVGDALVELGRYPDAFRAFERMVALKPNLASYARIAYARELTGDREGAIAAMRLALDAAGGAPEPTAWTLVELAKLELGSGRLLDAERSARAALYSLPGYVFAREQLARVQAARGRLRAAIAQASRAAEATPLPQLVALHADLLARAGRHAEARRQRMTVNVIERLLQANGVRVDLESTVYRADQRMSPLATVRLARSARAARPSIYGDDALGWALARAGRCREALPWLRRSLRLGTRDALLFFHRGYAEGCAGNRDARRAWYRKALDLSPAFSVRWAPVAQAALRGGQ